MPIKDLSGHYWSSSTKELSYVCKNTKNSLNGGEKGRIFFFYKKSNDCFE